MTVEAAVDLKDKTVSLFWANYSKEKPLIERQRAFLDLQETLAGIDEQTDMSTEP